ncbi:ABC transporter ATP-binding protein [Lapidilactobacillus achengensis]|uniref:ABC transporter ATP-binding protein n=1 Tax=Lapidilactobacillus achengensis TaxID=2486000 RepID=A0ABW1UMV1_9LACO|nr:ABC transporter ATP-binding protein [Lapidilactobacillus achengensis]
MNVELKHYTKKLKGRTILDDISLTLAPGHVYGLYGRNGSGKSMLIRAISGMILPTSGEVSVDGQRITVDIDFPESMGLIIENIQLQKAFTAKTNLQILGDIKKIATPEDIEWALTAVGLDPNSNEKVRSFSLGMNQKLAIAQAIFEKPQLILLDEPTNALDFQTVADFHQLIEQLQSPERIILLASHNRDDLTEVATDFLEMDAGKLYPRTRADVMSVGAQHA